MNGFSPRLLRPALRVAARWAYSPRATWPQSRRRLELSLRVGLPLPRGTAVTEATVGGVRCERIIPPSGAQAGELLYLHGGGFTTCSPRTHRAFVARLAHAARMGAWVPEYRLAPEHPFPAGLQDANAVCAGMLEMGIRPERLAVAGDSCGGNLVLGLALGRREAGEPLPAVLGSVCAWLDLTPEATARLGPAPRELALSQGLLARFARAYLNGQDPTHPLISPLLADLRGLPPLVIQTAADDLLDGQAAELAQRARRAGVAVTEQRYAERWHDFQLHVGVAPGALEAAGDLGRALANGTRRRRDEPRSPDGRD